MLFNSSRYETDADKQRVLYISSSIQSLNIYPTTCSKILSQQSYRRCFKCILEFEKELFLLYLSRHTWGNVYLLNRHRHIAHQIYRNRIEGYEREFHVEICLGWFPLMTDEKNEKCYHNYIVKYYWINIPWRKIIGTEIRKRNIVSIYYIYIHVYSSFDPN